MTEAKRPLKVFLCHAHGDKGAVKTLYTRLIEDGVDAWLDKEKLLPGQDWELEIRKAVREADVIVVCLSKQFNKAGFRQKEVRLALDIAMEKPEGEIFIIPARLEECNTLESLKKWHWVDLFEEDGYKLLLRALQLKLSGIIGGVEQKAFSIQYEQALQETLERERIETEVRLGRQIQQTFMPDSLPQTKGWSFAARWKTARQVGGDFYDVFDLPNDKVGFFIADVADKGVPAALFMALTRTLIRAAAIEVEEPATVLHRVNDLLMPDTRQGIFVTAVYAVLDIRANELCYANAGHNPPLWIKQDGAVELLMRTGMALGVIEDVLYGQRAFPVGRGDSVLFYTDGLTESINSDGDDFGEERLIQILRTHYSSSVELIIDVVEAALSDFMQDTPLMDDLTMLVIQRDKNP